MTCLRPLRAIVLAVTLAGGCNVRATIPLPADPLVATGAADLPGEPTELFEQAPFAMNVVSRRLDNGLTLLVSPGQADGLVSVVFVSRAWPMRDARAPEAVTRVAAGAMLRATRLEDGTIASDLLEGEGFAPDVEVLPEGLRVSERIVADELPRYVELLAQTLRAPAYRDEDLRVALAARIERLEGHSLTVDGVLDDRMPGFLYAPLDPRTFGSTQRLAALRGLSTETLLERHAQMLDPGRCAIVVTGDVQPEAAFALLEPLFGDLEALNGAPDVAPPDIRTDGPRGFAVVQPLIRAYVVLRERAPPLGHRDHAAYRVLEQLLGGMFGARLNLVLREESTVSYGFHAIYRASASEGEIELTTAIDPSHTRAVASLVISELRRVRGDDGQQLEARELELAITRARELLLSDLDSSLGLGRIIGRQVLGERAPEEVMSVLAALDALDATAVQAAARRWIRPDRAPLAVVASEGAVSAVQQAGLGEWTVLRAPRRQRR